MNENNLYYKRGMYIIDKLLKAYYNDSTFYKNRMELAKMELQRFSNNKSLMVKDINSFYITAMVSLFGLNKENIENMNKHENYDLYELSEKEKKSIDAFKRDYPDFDNDRKIITKFDEWLSVEQCDHPTLSYMMNIRNGILHSEYEPLDEYGDIISVKNSNYTHFKSKILLYGIMNFCIFYFGNNSWTGLAENFNLYGIDEINNINNEKELEEQLKTIKIIKVSYEAKEQQTLSKTPELRGYKLIKKLKNKDLSSESLLQKIFGKKYNYTVKEESLDAQQINLIKKMVKKYYGDKFYELNKDVKRLQLSSLTRYLVDNRGVISEWICDYVDFYNSIMNVLSNPYVKYNNQIEKLLENSTDENDRRSVFACRTSLLVLKLYHVLYRLQNKQYEEVDYNIIDFDLSSGDYSYQRTDVDGSITNNFDIDKAKLKLKYPTISEKELENKVICEIIRNSLSHGNIEMNFKIENDELQEYIVFEDIYHSKVRKLEMTLDKLEIFLKSEAFETKNCLIKEDKTKTR